MKAAYAVINDVLNEATAGAVRRFRQASQAEKRAALADAEARHASSSSTVSGTMRSSRSTPQAGWTRGIAAPRGSSAIPRTRSSASTRRSSSRPRTGQQGVPEQELKAAATTGHAGDDRWHVRKDGSRFFVSGAVTPIRDEAGTLRGYTKVCAGHHRA